MDTRRQALIEAGLERAAEIVGDVTGPVIAAYYRRFPEARASFEHHDPRTPHRLEAEMVENALYCVMNWFERRTEIEILLDQSVPHHSATLAVPPDWYSGLIAAVIEVILPTVPEEASDEREAWAVLGVALAARIDYNRQG